MKKIMSILALSALLSMAFTACGPEDLSKQENANQNGGGGNGGNNGGGNGGWQQEDEPFVFGAVDLGLDVLWANGNIGADAVDEIGDFFAWGEVATKTQYDWTTYKWCEGNYDKLTKYSNVYGYGVNDGNKELDLEGESIDDAARVVLKGDWRMPTEADFEDLLKKCDWKVYTTKKNVKGYLVTSKAEGNTNSIFLPLTGEMSGTELNETDTGLYWSSTLQSTGMPFFARHLVFGPVAPQVDATDRTFGFAVRAVKNK